MNVDESNDFSYALLLRFIGAQLLSSRSYWSKSVTVPLGFFPLPFCLNVFPSLRVFPPYHFGMISIQSMLIGRVRCCHHSLGRMLSQGFVRGFVGLGPLRSLFFSLSKTYFELDLNFWLIGNALPKLVRLRSMIHFGLLRFLPST